MARGAPRYGGPVPGVHTSGPARQPNPGHACRLHRRCRAVGRWKNMAPGALRPRGPRRPNVRT
eukprot:131910-Lingulodinium_polyedra.AAC.1